MDYIIVKWLHILSSTFLFGTGVGSAFYMLFATLTKDPRVVYVVVKYVVIADWLFTATTVVAQPLTGFYLVHRMGLPLTSRWILWSLILYVLAGMCWLPVVWLQLRMRELARHAAEHATELSDLYWRYFRLWIVLGIPAFPALIAVFYLMVAKPV